MGTFKILGIILIGLCGAVVGFAQTQIEKQEVPAWMELISDGGAKGKYLIPKGAKVRQVGSQVIIETPSEYMARRFYEMEQRLKKIEDKQEALQKDLQIIKKGLEELLVLLTDRKETKQ